MAYGHHLFRASGRPARMTIWAQRTPKISVSHLNFYYGSKQALADVSLLIPQNCVTAFIGPFRLWQEHVLTVLEPMNDLIDGTRVEGEVLLEWGDILGPKVDVVELRKRVRHGVPEIRTRFRNRFSRTSPTDLA